MTVIQSEVDESSLSMTLVAEFNEDIEDVWQLWADPRKLERWWGPPTHPATFASHDLVPGGRASFVMTGPRGELHHGWWEVRSVTPPSQLEFIDGFADADGNNVEEHPTSVVLVTLERHDNVTRMQITSSYQTRAGFDQMVNEGMEDGWRLCVGQMDAVLSAAPLPA